MHRQPVNCCKYPNRPASWVLNGRCFLLIPSFQFKPSLSSPVMFLSFYVLLGPLLQQVHLTGVPSFPLFKHNRMTIYKSELTDMRIVLWAMLIIVYLLLRGQKTNDDTLMMRRLKFHNSSQQFKWSPSSGVFYTSSHVHLPIYFPPKFQGVPNTFYLGRHRHYSHNIREGLKSLVNQGLAKYMFMKYQLERNEDAIN